jgi:hypothetical protein
MIKKFAILVALTLVVSVPRALALGKDKDKDKDKNTPAPTTPAPTPPAPTPPPAKKNDSELSTVSCVGRTFFTNVIPSACSGFWFGNENKGLTPDGGPVLTALMGLGFAGPAGVEKIESLADGAQFIDFSTMLYGETIIGIHWGGGVFNKVLGAPNGLGTAFFKFDAGVGVDKIQIDEFWRQSLSNAAVYKTGTRPPPDMGVVPEPSTYALLATGLVGVFGVARRRKAKL